LVKRQANHKLTPKNIIHLVSLLVNLTHKYSLLHSTKWKWLNRPNKKNATTYSNSRGSFRV